METATGTVTATEELVMELPTAVATATGTVRATASATGEPLVVAAALATVSGTAAATVFYLLCIMGLLTVNLLTRIIMVMTTLFPTTVMDYMTLTRFQAATTAATIIASTAAKTIVTGITTLAESITSTAALNFHPAAPAAALQHQLLAAVPAVQLILSALPLALAPGPVHLHMLLCPIRGLQGLIFTREEATLALIFSSTLSFML